MEKILCKASESENHDIEQHVLAQATRSMQNGTFISWLGTFVSVWNKTHDPMRSADAWPAGKSL